MNFHITTVVLMSLLAYLAYAGAPEEKDMYLPISTSFPRVILLGQDTNYIELTLTVPKYCFSFSKKVIAVESDTEGVPEEVDNSTKATMQVYLQQETDVGGNWTDLDEIFSIDYDDAGFSRLVAGALKSTVETDSFLSSHRHRLSIRTNSNDTIVVKVHVVTMGTYGQVQAWLGLAVLVVTYGIMTFELAERALLGLSASFITLILLLIGHKEYKLEEVATWLDQSTFVLLFGMMVIVKIFGDTGFFEWLAVQCIKLSKGRIRLLFVLICTLTGVLSAFLDNVTTVLLTAPITIRVSEVLDISPVPFLIGQALMSNIGGTATLVGDPPNIIIGSMLKDYVDFMSFIYNLAPLVVISFGVCILFLLFWWRHSVAGTRNINMEEIAKEGVIKDKVKFIKSMIVLGFVLAGFFTSSLLDIEPAWIALAGATALMLLTYPKHIEHPLTGVEWNTLLFFVSLFVLVIGMSKLGLIRMIVGLIALVLRTLPEKWVLIVAMTMILWFSALLSAIISSIPTTTTFIPVLVELCADPILSSSLKLRPLIWALAFGACFGGNGTLIGAAANVVVAGIVRQKGYFISFVQFTKVGFPVMIISTAMANIWIILLYAVIGFEGR